MSRKRRQARWFPGFRWIGLAAVAALLGLYAMNLRWWPGWTPSRGTFVGVQHGAFVIGGNPSVGWDRFVLVWPRCQGSIWDWSTWITWGRLGPSWWITVPIWIPLVAAAGVTARAWRRHRRARRGPGACLACGYDLAGLTGGVCPECGANGVPDECRRVSANTAASGQPSS